MGSKVVYQEEYIGSPYKVSFLNEKGVSLVRGFDSEYLARKFVNKISHSKKCKLISCPLFD